MGVANEGVIYFEWFLDGVLVQDGTVEIFEFTPAHSGVYNLVLQVTDDEGMQGVVDSWLWIPPPVGSSDLDLNGVTDLADHAALFGCFGGPEVAIAPICNFADIDVDGDVDLMDFGVLQFSFNAP